MLTDLVVENLGVIDRAEVTLGGGCTVLTGETGAGKTLVVAALGLLLGERADKTLVRSGAREARVEARFTLPDGHPALQRLASNGLVDGADEAPVEVIVARTVAADGGSRARVNGRMATAATLAELGPSLVEIAGQHAHDRIGGAARQRELLDAFAGEECERLQAEVAAAVRRAGDAARRADALASDERARAREIETLRSEIHEIDAAGIEPGEMEALSAEATRLEHAEALAGSLGAAAEALRGEGGAEELLASASRAIESASRHDGGAAPLAERLRAAAYEVGDVAHELGARVVAPDPEALEALRSRLAELARLRRRYGGGETDVLAYLESARARLAALESSDLDRERWSRERDELYATARAAAERLSRLRASAAVRLERALTDVLHELALGDARFEVRLEPRPLYEGGTETVTFAVAANPGEEPRALTKVASGGELARIALALHLVTSRAAATTMVFDEVDAGVGGEAAGAVGRRLAELARTAGAQVVVVTHLPQVAAFADAHLRVTKRSVRGRARAEVTAVEGEERVAELSRMLAGLPGSARARGHAQELLELASR